jgi:hypothetical protein
MARKAKAKQAKKAPSVPVTVQSMPDAPAPKKFIPAGVPFTKANRLAKPERDASAIANPRQSVLEAFGRIGGVRWLVKYSKRDPKGFAGLLAKAMPQDVNVTGTMGYVPMQIPVEVRDAIPGEFTEVSPLKVLDVIEADPFT